MTPLLQVEKLQKSFGGLRVSQDISLTLAPGDRVALIGPNGAGKTTFVNLVTGQLRPDRGRILLGGVDVTAAGVEARVRRGLVRTFQITRLFQDMEVLDNVLLAILQRERKTARFLRNAQGERGPVDEAQAILRQLGLGAVARRRIREIAYGQQRLVEIAIAVALRPRVLLLDEPAAGVSRAEAPRIVEAIDALPAEIAVLMIEHDMDLVLRFARRVVVLASGAAIFDGLPSAVVADPAVRAAYLGSYAGTPA
ncbi:ABC transporter ATP-binding protein [Enterovirga sp.]|uniref:ABC transporter ATP-binding protein n=1 Tax=Enterovirga sp. TaxID=2026350 RepID=UPI00263668E5|nr:ABC transporter ATP-binding protein [Enterovirga sp.]MDB5589852.1 branched-chain amino acid transporter ATP-binding protein [Enterovirga sp.]